MIWNISGSADDLRYAFRSPGGAFGGPTTLTEPDGPLGPRVAIDQNGEAVAAWSALIAPTELVRWAAAPPGGPFGPPVPMPPGGPGVFNDLEMNAEGTALAFWVDTSGPVWEMRASSRSPGGIFGDPTALPGPTQGANVSGAAGAINAAGDAAAVWNGPDPVVAGPHDVPLLASVLEVPRPEAPPSIGGLRVVPRRFPVGQAPTAKISRNAGTTIRLRLSKPATLRLTVQRARPGVRVKVKGRSRCLPPTAQNRRRAQGKRRCTRFRKVGTLLRRNRSAGADKIRFSGRIGRKALRLGRHRIVAVAIDGASQRSSPRRAGFRVVK
jgi:hypothetical protein